MAGASQVFFPSSGTKKNLHPLFLFSLLKENIGKRNDENKSSPGALLSLLLLLFPPLDRE